MNYLKRGLSISVRCFSTSQRLNNYETLKVSELAPYVKAVEMNRPDKLNSMNVVFWREMRECFRELNYDESCRAIVLSGNGRVFTAGLALDDPGQIGKLMQGDVDIARKGKIAFRLIREYQDSFTAIEKCEKPVIAAVHSACVGGGTNMICAADFRLCTTDAWFQIKEVVLGLAADVGVLQRMSKIVGSDGIVREMALTGRKMLADEAKTCGFVNRVFPDKKKMMDVAIEMAKTIAGHSPVAVQGTKINLNYARDHTVDESLDYHARINALNLLSEDVLSEVNRCDDAKIEG